MYKLPLAFGAVLLLGLPGCASPPRSSEAYQRLVRELGAAR